MLNSILNAFKNKTNKNYVSEVLPMPTSQTEEALYLLIKNKKMSRRDFFLDGHILNATAIISDLRKLDVNIGMNRIDVENKFGRAVSYGVYFLKNESEAISTYLKLIKKSKK